MYKILTRILTVLLLFPFPVSAQKIIQTQVPYSVPNYLPDSAYYAGHYNPRSRYSRHSNSRFADINDLERYATGRNFFRENDITRIERMEMLTFGAIQNGDINTRYSNVRNAILSRPKQNVNTSILRGIGNYFKGQMTGFTPQIDSFDNNLLFNNSNFGRNSVVDYSTPWGSIHRSNSFGTGSSAGVHILD